MASVASRGRGNPLPSIDFDGIRRNYSLVAEVEKTVQLKAAASNELKGLCPFHDEKSPSFTIYADRRRWHCFGCDRDGDVLDFIGERDGLSLVEVAQQLTGDGVPGPAYSSAPAAKHAVFLRGGQTIVASFDFLGADGGLLYRKHRIEPGADREKEFRYDRPNGTGGWLPGQGEAKVPYRLPDLVAAPDALMYMAEGEAKADRLAEWGLLATSLKDWRSDFDTYVAGRRVVILPDNDNAGEMLAGKTVELLERAGAHPVIVRLPDLPDKGDVLDWNGDREHLEALVAAATVQDSSLPLATLDLAELAGIQPRAKAFAIERIAPLGEVTLFTGPGSAGKSLLAQQLATAAAAGLTCLGLDLLSAPAIYLTAEDGADQLHWRQAHICEAMRVPMASLAGNLHLVSLRGALDNELGTFTAEGQLKPSPAFWRLVQMIRATGAGLVFLDNVAHLYTGNENDRGEVTRFINMLNRAAGETGAAIVLVAHPNKSGDSYSGSTAWLNAVRSQLFIDHDRDGDGFAVDPDARVLSVGKANYAQKGEALRFRWHNWAFVRDEDLPSDVRGEIAEVSKANAENAAFLRCLAAAAASRRAVSHNPGTNYAPTVFSRMTEGKNYSRKAYEAAFERLLHLGEIEIEAPLWQDAHRHWKQGIRAVEKCGDPPAATPCGDLREPHA